MIELYYPAKPFFVRQPFGANPERYSQFLDQNGNPQKGHMGVDLLGIHGTPVYSPVNGTAKFVRDSHGGEGLYILTDDWYDYEGQQVKFTIILWHMIGDTDPKFPNLIPVSKQVKIGELVGFADNTGAPYESSGDHLHLGLYPSNIYGNFLLVSNGYNGGIDPLPYFNGFFAQDINSVEMLKKGLSEIPNDIKIDPKQATEKLNALAKLFKYLSNIFQGL